MIIHYLTTAFVNIRAAPITTAAKIFTLALGLFTIIAVTGVVAYWRSTDAQIAPDAERTVLFTTAIDEGATPSGNATPLRRTGSFVARYLKEDIPELEAVARFRQVGEVAASTGGREMYLTGARADPEFLEVFQFEFIAGERRSALQSQDGAVLTQSAAQRLFGEAPALGRRFVLEGGDDLIVTGVIAPVPDPSQFSQGDLAFDYLVPMAAGGPAVEIWAELSVVTYGVLPADGSLTREGLPDRLAQMIDQRMSDRQKAIFSITMDGLALERVTETGLNLALFGLGGSSLTVVGVFFGLGLLVLVIACLNYANLAAIQATGRAREVGMRRVLGAGRFGVLTQSWVEAALATAVAALLSATCLALASPFVAQQMGVDILGALSRNVSALAWIAGLTAALILAAGLYPAFVVSRARPAEVVRAGKVRQGSRLAAQVLVGLQFASASALLIALLVVGFQNAHMRQLALARSDDPIVVLKPQARTGMPVDALRQQLAAYPQIEAVGESRFRPWAAAESMWRATSAPGDASLGPNSNLVTAGFGYFDVYEQEVLAGRVFTQERDTPDPALMNSDAPTAGEQIVIDWTLAQQQGFASPEAAVGQRLFSGQDANEIIGVVEPRADEIQSGSDGGTIFILRPGRPTHTPLIRISADDLDGGIAAIRRVLGELAPLEAIDLEFEDQIFEQNFRAFDQVGRLFVAVSLLAFLISTIGLFGMATHVTQRRRHEIGVRKTLGSSVREVVQLLLTDFSKPVIVANLIAWPAGYLAAQFYVSTFAHPLSLSVWPFALSMLITLAIAWLAVGGQTFKAASVRPAQVLRDA
jgi:putative ABC transport system permease protein